jgi:hypothetical protein
MIGPTQRILLETHKTHKRQTSLPPERFETATPAKESLQTHALDRAVRDYRMNVQLIGINIT